MPNSNRRTFPKNVGQGTLAADVGLGLPGRALPNAAEDTENGNFAWPYPTAYNKEIEIDVDVVVLVEALRVAGRRSALPGKD